MLGRAELLEDRGGIPPDVVHRDAAFADRFAQASPLEESQLGDAPLLPRPRAAMREDE